MQTKTTILIILILTCFLVSNTYAHAGRGYTPLQFFGFNEISLTAGIWDDLWKYIYINKTANEFDIYTMLDVHNGTLIRGVLDVMERVKIFDDLNMTGNNINSVNDLTCNTCIDTEDIGDNEVTKNKVNFNYADSNTKGGGANSCNGDAICEMQNASVNGNLNVTGSISSKFYDLGVDCFSQCADSTHTKLIYSKEYESCFGIGATCDEDCLCIEGIGCSDCGETITDFDGNSYDTVKIGDQCWMAENMRTTKNPTGTSITRYCYNDTSSICDIDGGLYTWNTAMNGATTEGAQGICPDDWHIPTDAEFTILTNYLGANAGIQLRVGGTSGFESIFTGYKTDLGGYYDRGRRAFFWSSNQTGNSAWIRYMLITWSSVDRVDSSKACSLSVRCVK